MIEFPFQRFSFHGPCHRGWPDNQRSVEVCLTDAGEQTYLFLDAAGSRMISDLLDLIPKERRVAIVDAMEELANLLNPNNAAFQKLLRGCRCKDHWWHR